MRGGIGSAKYGETDSIVALPATDPLLSKLLEKPFVLE